jgi:hypothetical protein
MSWLTGVSSRELTGVTIAASVMVEAVFFLSSWRYMCNMAAMAKKMIPSV